VCVCVRASWTCPVWARGHCRISPPRFLAECFKRQLNQDSFVLLYFRLSTFSDLYWDYLSVFSCTVLFVSISQVIGSEERLRNDLYCVEWGVKLYSDQTKASWTDLWWVVFLAVPWLAGGSSCTALWLAVLIVEPGCDWLVVPAVLHCDWLCL